MYGLRHINTILLYFYKKIDELVNIFEIFIGGKSPKIWSFLELEVRSDD